MAWKNRVKRQMAFFPSLNTIEFVPKLYRVRLFFIFLSEILSGGKKNKASQMNNIAGASWIIDKSEPRFVYHLFTVNVCFQAF